MHGTGQRKYTSLQRATKSDRETFLNFTKILHSFICASEYVTELSIFITFCIGTVSIALILCRIRKKKEKIKKGDPFPNLIVYHTASCVCTRRQRREKKKLSHRSRQDYLNSEAYFQLITGLDVFSWAQVGSKCLVDAFSPRWREILLKPQRRFPPHPNKVKIPGVVISLSTNYLVVWNHFQRTAEDSFNEENGVLRRNCNIML